jgi:hypothetical protein
MLIKFSILQNGYRVPLLDENGREVTLNVDAPTKTLAIYSKQVTDFCAAQGNDCRVREVR